MYESISRLGSITTPNPIKCSRSFVSTTTTATTAPEDRSGLSGAYIHLALVTCALKSSLLRPTNKILFKILKRPNKNLLYEDVKIPEAI